MDGVLNRTQSDPPVSWLGVLAGIVPFLLVGPAMVLLAYPYPPPAWRTSAPTSTLILAAYLVPLVLGIVIGWAKHWPVWAYAYLGPTLVVPGILAANEITGITRSLGWLGALLAGPLILAVFVLMLGVLLLIVRRWAAGRALAQGISRDWTRLSFSLFLTAGFIFGSIDHDEDPQLTAAVILPTLVIVAAAGVYLRTRTQAMRALTLLVGLCLATAIRVAGGKFFYAMFALILAGVIFWPMLLQLIPHGRSPADSTSPR